VAILSASIAVSAATAAGAAPAASPLITNYRASPDQLTWRGGPLTLSADTSDATTCRWSSNYAIKGLPSTGSCSGGHPSISLDIARNTGKTVKNIGFTLKAVAADKAFYAETLYIHEEPQPATITSFTASTTKLPDTGGNVTLTGKVKLARVCILTSKPEAKGLPASFNCSSGTVTKTVRLPGTTSGRDASVDFELTVSGFGQGTANAQTTVFVEARPPTVIDFAASPKSLPSSGGIVTLTAKVTDAVACNYGDAWSGGIKKGVNPAEGLPKSIKCASGTVRLKVTIRRDRTKLGEKISFVMTVDSQSANVTARGSPVVREAKA
jgi:hypothetical protein